MVVLVAEVVCCACVMLVITDNASSGGGQGGLTLPLPVTFNPGSRPVFFGSRPFAFFRLRNIAQCCLIFPLFSRFPPPWESRFPPPLLPPPVHLPPFLPVSRPPVPPPTIKASMGTYASIKCANGLSFLALKNNNNKAQMAAPTIITASFI